MRVEFKQFTEGAARGILLSRGGEGERKMEAEADVARRKANGGGQQSGGFAGPLLLQEHVAERTEHFRIPGELRLTRRQEREAFLRQFRRGPPIAGGNVGEAEVAGVGGRTGPPGAEGHGGARRLERFRTNRAAGDAMVRDGGMAAVDRSAPGHMAANAILTILGMARGGQIAVAVHACLAVVVFAAVDTMARSAPHHAAALLEAAAGRELFDVADDVKRVRTGRPHKDGE